MTERKTLAEVINEKIDYAIEAMEYAYKNKVFVVWTGTRIENFFKTKKSAETYLSKQESVSYYDDYTKDMRNCGSGLSVDFVNVSELVDIKTDKQIWYKEIRRKMAYSHMVKNVIENAKYNEVSEETLIFIEDLVNDYLETGGLKIPDFSEKEIQKTV